jgi:GNAT superfamily N-acetyltransferase
MTELTSRLAVRSDIRALTGLMAAAIGELQRGFLDDAHIESSRAIMGIDTQLIDDEAYFVVEADGELAGCGGWSRRATLYGSDTTPGRDGQLLDPAVDAARVRAMYTHPAFARPGVGRLVLSLCATAAASEGFARLELVSTLAGEPALLGLRVPPARAARGRDRRGSGSDRADGEADRPAPAGALVGAVRGS